MTLSAITAIRKSYNRISASVKRIGVSSGGGGTSYTCTSPEGVGMPPTAPFGPIVAYSPGLDNLGLGVSFGGLVKSLVKTGSLKSWVDIKARISS